MSPDRISLYSFAYLPNRFAPQKRINRADLPSAQEKLAILKLSINLLTQAGYVYIGMDHFAKKEGPLAVAQRRGSLYRNFQGYSTHSSCDLIGMGCSAISSIGTHYAQNIVSLEPYYDFIKNKQIPISKGIVVDNDDIIRKAIIMELICNFSLSYSKIEDAYNLEFGQYFNAQIDELESFESDGLVTSLNDKIIVTPKGRLLIRNICSVFDRYYCKSRKSPPFSKAI